MGGGGAKRTTHLAKVLQISVKPLIYIIYCILFHVMPKQKGK